MSCSSDISTTDTSGSATNTTTNESDDILSIEEDEKNNDDRDYICESKNHIRDESESISIKDFSISNAKLGFGTFANVWVCKNKDEKMYACKVQKGNDIDTAKSFESEALIMKKFKDVETITNIVDIVNSCKDEKCSENKKIIIMELHGLPLTKVLSQTRQNIPCVKLIIKQLLQALEAIHSEKIIHADVKPDNILTNVGVNSQTEIKNIKLSDFGSFVNFGENSYSIQTKNYRAPEIILQYKCNEKCDIWSVGCVMYELLTGELLFSPYKTKRYTSNYIHIFHMIQLFGEIPDILINSKKGMKIFNNDGVVAVKKKIEYISLHKLVFKHVKPTKSKYEEYINMMSFMYSLFEYDPDKRPSASECLKHKWLN